ncbi:hypothetical protein VNO78_30378 [Psophocarpus tetragonolobus]|uniref:Uncharacterized protein n=1 Tax=Psophocarpus tetragonolobus TaxID=3891 RepID=A0AAN9RWN3_PSOTE
MKKEGLYVCIRMDEYEVNRNEGYKATFDDKVKPKMEVILSACGWVLVHAGAWLGAGAPWLGAGARWRTMPWALGLGPWAMHSRPLCHLQYPIAYLSRLQRILPAARWELHFKASHRANPPCEGRQRHVPLGGRGPLLLVGKRTTGARVASSPDSDLEAFSHNPTHGSFAPLAFQPSAMTNCANQRFLSY